MLQSVIIRWRSLQASWRIPDDRDMTLLQTYLPTALCAVLLGLLSGHSFADDMYKTVDAQGKVTFSDRPLSPASQRISVDVTQGDPAEAARIRRQQAQMNAEAAQSVKQAQQDASDQAKKAALQAQQQQRCAAARARYAMFAAGGRLFRTDEYGNRVYYSDQEINQQRDAARTAMEGACNTQP
jgi:cell pole-organizing protein PopZ